MHEGFGLSNYKTEPIGVVEILHPSTRSWDEVRKEEANGPCRVLQLSPCYN